jgi:hypothetical protein
VGPATDDEGLRKPKAGWPLAVLKMLRTAGKDV